jgi:hypothetical protein
MGNLSPTVPKALKADHYQLYMAPKYGPFTLAQGIQSSDLKIDVPNEVIDEIGNDSHRGIVTDIPTVSFTLEGLNTDSYLEQVYTGNHGWVVFSGEVTGTTMNSAKVYPYIVGPIKTSGELLISTDTGGITYHIDQSGIGVFAKSLILGKTYQLSGAYIQNFEISLDTSLSGVMTMTNAVKVVIGMEKEWTTTEFEDAETDVLFVKRDNTISSDPKGLIFNTIYVDGPILKSMSANADANGNTTTSFENEGDVLTYGDGYILRKSYIAQASDATAKNIIDLDSVGVLASGIENPIAGKSTGAYANKYFRKVTVIKTNGSRYELTENTVSGKFESTISGLDKYYNFAEGATTLKEIHLSNDITAGDRYEFTCFTLKQAAFGSQFESGYAFQFSNDNAAIRGRYVPVRFGVGNNVATLDTAQSASFTVNFGRDRIQSLGGGDTVAYAPAPIPELTAEVNTFASDLSMVRLMATGNKNDTGTEYSANEFGTFTTASDQILRIRMNKPSDNATLLKEYEMSGMAITSITEGISVGNSATLNVSLTSKTGNLTISR